MSETETALITAQRGKKTMHVTEEQLKKQILLIYRAHYEEKKQIYEILNITLPENTSAEDQQKIHESIYTMLTIYAADANGIGRLSGYLRNLRKAMNKYMKIRGIPDGTTTRLVKQLYLQLFLQYVLVPESFGIQPIKIPWNPWSFTFKLGNKVIEATITDVERLKAETEEDLKKEPAEEAQEDVDVL